MGHLGDFGTARPPADATFGYFGETLRANPNVSDLAVVELFSTLGGLEGDKDAGAAEAIGVLRQIGSTLVHEDDLDRFWSLARANRQTMEDLAELAMSLVAALTDRPTELPSDSSGGQQTTDTRSEADSSLPALRLLEGRPDLQVAVLRAQEAV